MDACHPVAMDPGELADRCAEAMYAADSASRRLGIVIHDVGPGRATATMTVADEMLNGHGICHGGYVFTLADTAFAFACNTYDDRTVAAGARRGRSGIYDVTVYRDETNVVAEFRGRSRSMGERLL